MKVYLPFTIAAVAGTMMIVFGVVSLLVTLSSPGLSSVTALWYVTASIGIVTAGIMNISLVYDRVGRSAIAANVVGSIGFVLGVFFHAGVFTLFGSLLFAAAWICSFLVAERNDVIRSYPYGLYVEK